MGNRKGETVLTVKPVFHQTEFSAHRGKLIVFHRIPPSKAYAEKSDQVQLFRR